ncbi:hypothetical protein TSOC_010176 [Tetrabaena socialis]|uniref:BACK domain-containing protein n=1 Tax=Tetrabaena socialis TaxID=47790 RepID=A0A2J7ZTX8_9CHLO|nr:hypothetical protein TSOC_010176 [Tetrabaena socialis]|eukprot:PNH03736.1 hypothetical protein TSOC_010176 [Tetrabaena socialis]
MASTLTSYGYVASLFGSEELADCVISFCQGNDVQAPPAKRRKTDGDGLPTGAAPGAAKEAKQVSSTSAKKAMTSTQQQQQTQQAERWTPEQQQAGSKPELRVPLGSPEDLPHALSALRFMYTGKVDGSSAAQLLQMRRQAAYLLVEGCVEACDAALLARVSSGAAQQPAEGVGSSSSSSLAPVIELFACRHLLPEPEESGGDALITALLRACRQQLVLHGGGLAEVVGAAGQSAIGGSGSLGELLAWAFRDAPSLLCDPDTRQQMEVLPAAAIEALLGSDSFATDDEATLSEDYLLGTLPFIPWFPISREEHAFLCQHVSAAARDASKRARLEESAAGRYDTSSPWYAAGARPCRRSDLNHRYGWHIKQEDLLAMEAAQKTKKTLSGSFDNGAASGLVSHGFEWQPFIHSKAEDETAGVYLDCSMPAALCIPANSKRIISLASTSARLVVHRWGGEDGSSREVAHVNRFLRSKDYMKVGKGLGKASALPLAPRLNAGMQGGDGMVPLHMWGPYLHEGKLTGSLKFL